ncbi:MAG: ATP-binding cassette domain-containing protein, partial [Sulfurimonas sp.]|nr:ATP-binding cassette domain-containing protein [Sulfurimonas sp.]
NGIIHVDNEIWLDVHKCKSIQKREIGFVFQDYALFDNMSVLENLLYVKKELKLADHLLEVTELSELRNRAVTTLSGGQKQRVALCRAMMKRPKVLLLDEPLSALDPSMRGKLQNEILALHKEFGTTTIMVSHDPSEIYKLASRVIVLENGKIINDGAPKEVLLRTQGSQKFSFEGELLEIKKVDIIFVAIVAIGQQLVEIVISGDEANGLKIGDLVSVSTKAFNGNLKKNQIT